MLLLRIHFSDKFKKAKLLTLMEPIFISKKLNGVPKMIITQFCRGKSLIKTAKLDGVETSEYVNGQASERLLFEIK